MAIKDFIKFGGEAEDELDRIQTNNKNVLTILKQADIKNGYVCLSVSDMKKLIDEIQTGGRGLASFQIFGVIMDGTDSETMACLTDEINSTFKQEIDTILEVK